MKIWNGFGSEHSMNLVMIGHFKDATSSATAQSVIEQITEQVQADYEEIDKLKTRFPDGVSDLLKKLKVHSIVPSELEQFVMDVTVKSEGSQIRINTDEVDVSAFLKILLDKGARVEVYSAHNHPVQEGSNEE